MKLSFPSHEFDEAVAAVCHGSFSDEQAQALNELLRSHLAARDEYIVRVELHARLASDPDLFVAATPPANEAPPSGALQEQPQNVFSLQPPPHGRKQMLGWAMALAACVALMASGWWGWREWR